MPRRVLTREDVELIRQLGDERDALLASGMRKEARKISSRAIGRKFGVSKSCIVHVLQYRNWV